MSIGINMGSDNMRETNSTKERVRKNPELLKDVNEWINYLPDSKEKRTLIKLKYLIWQI